MFGRNKALTLVALRLKGILPVCSGRICLLFVLFGGGKGRLWWYILSVSVFIFFVKKGVMLIIARDARFFCGGGKGRKMLCSGIICR